MKEISILLPSLRKELLEKRIEQWNLTNSNINFELVVVSPFEVKGDNVLWIRELNRKGSVNATNIAYAFSSADYVTYFSDDVKPTKDCLKNMLDFMNIEKYISLGAFKMETLNGREIGPFGAYNKFYACYGCIHKKDLEILNNILFRPEFLYSWADIDLSLRVWDKKGEVKKCNNAAVIPEQIEDEIYKSHRNTFQNDFNTFVNFWHSKFGKDMEKIDGVINRRLK